MECGQDSTRTLHRNCCPCAATPVIIDTDMGSDDVMAISLLLAHREIPIEAITVVNGLAHVRAGAANARRLVQASGRNSVLVLEGRETPLQRTADFPREWREGSDRPVTAASPPAPTITERGEVWLARRLKDGGASRPHSGARTARPTWPSLSPAPRRSKKSSSWAERSTFPAISAMEARSKPPTPRPNGTSSSIRKPPRESFDSGVPIRVVPLDATSRVKLDAAFLARFQRESRGTLAQIVSKVLNGEREMIDQGVFYAWDPLAAAALLDPIVATWTPAHVAMRVSGNEAGHSVIVPGIPNARVALDASRERFEKLFLEALAAR